MPALEQLQSHLLLENFIFQKVFTLFKALHFINKLYALKERVWKTHTVCEWSYCCYVMVYNVFCSNTWDFFLSISTPCALVVFSSQENSVPENHISVHLSALSLGPPRAGRACSGLGAHWNLVGGSKNYLLWGAWRLLGANSTVDHCATPPPGTDPRPRWARAFA